MSTLIEPTELDVDVDRMRRMLAAGRLVVTVESVAHAKHVTFRLRAPRNAAPDSYTRYLDVADAASEYGWSAVSIVETNGDGGPVTARPSRYADAGPVVRKAAAILLDALAGLPHDGYVVWAESACGRCGRPLTTPESVESGIGPECARKIGAPRTRNAGARS